MIDGWNDGGVDGRRGGGMNVDIYPLYSVLCGASWCLKYELTHSRERIRDGDALLHGMLL